MSNKVNRCILHNTCNQSNKNKRRGLTITVLTTPPLAPSRAMARDTAFTTSFCTPSNHTKDVSTNLSADKQTLTTNKNIYHLIVKAYMQKCNKITYTTSSKSMPLMHA